MPPPPSHGTNGSPQPMQPWMLLANLACFLGFSLSTLAFGGLVAFYAQVVQILLLYPSRDQKFWLIVTYSFALVPFGLVSFVGQFAYAVMMFVLHGQAVGGGAGFFSDQPPPWGDVINRISEVIIPCFADLLLFYRLKVLWNRQWKKVFIPFGLLYILRLGMTIAVLSSLMKPPCTLNTKANFILQVALSTANVALNGSFTGLVCYRLHSLRNGAEQVLGRLQATLYNSYTTIFVESGALFTLWTVAYLIVNAMSSWIRPAFSDPCKYIIILTRILMVLRIAQNRAWTVEIINASEDGNLNWEASSGHSVELNYVRNSNGQENKL